MICDGAQARVGAPGAGKECFKPWRTVSGREDAPAAMPELQEENRDGTKQFGWSQWWLIACAGREDSL